MKIVTFTGGVGGAKLADGLSRITNPDDLTIVVNPGNHKHLGLYISPDLDTVCYTLAGLAKMSLSSRDDTFHVLENLQKIGGPTWFRLA